MPRAAFFSSINRHMLRIAVPVVQACFYEKQKQ